jgi:hypothetical protein
MVITVRVCLSAGVSALASSEEAAAEEPASEEAAALLPELEELLLFPHAAMESAITEAKESANTFVKLFLFIVSSLLIKKENIWSLGGGSTTVPEPSLRFGIFNFSKIPFLVLTSFCFVIRLLRQNFA